MDSRGHTRTSRQLPTTKPGSGEQGINGIFPCHEDDCSWEHQRFLRSLHKVTPPLGCFFGRFFFARLAPLADLV